MQTHGEVQHRRSRGSPDFHGVKVNRRVSTELDGDAAGSSTKRISSTLSVGSFYPTVIVVCGMENVAGRSQMGRFLS